MRNRRSGPGGAETNFRGYCSKYGLYLIMSEGIIDLHHIIGLLV